MTSKVQQALAPQALEAYEPCSWRPTTPPDLDLSEVRMVRGFGEASPVARPLIQIPREKLDILPGSTPKEPP